MILLLDIGKKPNKTCKKLVKKGVFVCQKCGCVYERRIDIPSTSTCNGCRIRLKRVNINGQDRIYSIWRSMRKRCYSPNRPGYKNYGGRGVEVCDEWADYLTFEKWCLNNGYKDNLSIDRINNDGNYEPGNCRFSTMATQLRNTRRLRSTNTTGYRGVCKKKGCKKYSVSISVNYKRVTLGSFKDPITAAKAYDKYVIDNNLEHTINFPDSCEAE